MGRSMGSTARKNLCPGPCWAKAQQPEPVLSWAVPCRFHDYVAPLVGLHSGPTYYKINKHPATYVLLYFRRGMKFNIGNVFEKLL